ncbi:MAG: hypothetical protein MUF63_16440 [Rhodobacteraceae bacterium]|jgi:hypothetical protein|nr:hypothetical protein [Paracoccaceae bacterium]
MTSDGALRADAGVVIYSCTSYHYDFDIDPFEATRGAAMVRFSDGPPKRGNWTRLPVPEPAARQPSPALVNRYMKFFPGRFFADAEIAVYVDGNILIRSDLSPLVAEFRASGADIALFRHPSGRTLDEEIDFALEHRVKPEQRDDANRQRERYRTMGLLDQRISENSIIFYRLGSDRLSEFCRTWWDETTAHAHRDQFSLPYALRTVPLQVHYWDFHFKKTPNPYFDRYPHRRGSARNQWIQVTEFLGNHKLRYQLLSYLIHPSKIMRTMRKRGLVPQDET